MRGEPALDVGQAEVYTDTSCVHTPSVLSVFTIMLSECLMVNLCRQKLSGSALMQLVTQDLGCFLD